MLNKFIEKYGQLILLVISLLSIILAIIIFYRLNTFGSSEPIQIIKNSESEEGTNSNKRKMITVDISGEVKKPGIYKIEEEARINDLLEKAGGLTKNADILYINKNINKAEKLTDSQKIYIPAKEELDYTIESDSSSISNLSNKVSINNASLEELQSLPGIGETYANRIIESRPFSSIDEIKNVKGIGDATFEKIKELISI